VSSDLDLTYTIIWSLALANVLGAGTCMVLARPIAKLTAVPFNLLAPFMIMVVSFAAAQATRSFMDLVILFGVGLIGVLLKRFGWSRPAFLIGFVLAPLAEGYLNLAVQFYGFGMLTRPGVVIILAVIAVSVWLGARNRGGLGVVTHGDAPNAAIEDRRPQQVFLGGAILILLYTLWSSFRLSPLGSMFPISVGIVTLGFCSYLLFVLRTGGVDNSANYDTERGSGEIGEGLWKTTAWFGAFLGAAGILGFIPGTAVFFVAFLKFKARCSAQQTAGLTLAAVAVLLLFTNVLIVELPEGLLEGFVNFTG